MDSQIWIPALTGGVAGALLTQLSGLVLARWRRPRLRISFSINEPGCAVDTPVVRPPRPGDGLIEQGGQRVLRLRIRTGGRTTAHRASVVVSEITFYPATGAPKIAADEALDLQLAITGQTQFDLPPGVHRYVDVFFADEFGGAITARFAFQKVPMRFANIGYGLGSYSMKLLASCDDCQAAEYRINWHWDGSRAGLRPT